MADLPQRLICAGTDLIELVLPHLRFGSTKPAEDPFIVHQRIDTEALLGGSGPVALEVLGDEGVQGPGGLFVNDEGCGVDSGQERRGPAGGRRGAGGFLAVARTRFKTVDRGHFGNPPAGVLRGSRARTRLKNVKPLIYGQKISGY